MAKTYPPRDSFVAKVVADPKNPPNTLLLTGYLGDSAEDGHSRLYFDPELRVYVDIPDDAILHAEAQDESLGGHFIWIREEAEVIHGRAQPQATRARFFEGPIMQRFAGQAQQAGPIGNVQAGNYQLGNYQLISHWVVCQSQWCPSQNIACQTLDCPTFGGCPSAVDGCPSGYCPWDPGTIFEPGFRGGRPIGAQQPLQPDPGVEQQVAFAQRIGAQGGQWVPQTQICFVQPESRIGGLCPTLLPGHCPTEFQPLCHTASLKNCHTSTLWDCPPSIGLQPCQSWGFQYCPPLVTAPLNPRR